MSDMTALERSYRRILACYPRSFLRENADEILAVLLDTAVWAIGLASVVLIFTPAAGRYYRPRLAQQ